MGKSHQILIKETKKYKRKLHLLPLILGIFGSMVSLICVLFDDLVSFYMIILLILSFAASVLSSIIPIFCGCVFICDSLIFASAFLNILDGFGLFGCFILILAAVFTFRLRKDLLSQWGW